MLTRGGFQKTGLGRGKAWRNYELIFHDPTVLDGLEEKHGLIIFDEGKEEKRGRTSCGRQGINALRSTKGVSRNHNKRSRGEGLSSSSPEEKKKKRR